MIKVSVVTVVYNAEKTIESCIKSVCNQDYSNIEYIIIDGGSTDGTVDIIKKYHQSVDVFITEKDDGMYNALNKALELITGDYYISINADDMLYSNKVISILVENVKRNPGFSVYYGDLVIKKRLGMVYRRSFQATLKEIVSYGTSSIITQPASLINFSINREVRFDESFKCASDYDYIIKCIENGKAYYIREFVTVFSRVEESITNTQSELMSLETKVISSKYKSKYVKSKLASTLYKAFSNLRRVIANW